MFVLLLTIILFSTDAYGNTATPFFRKDYEFNSDTQNFYKVHTIGRSWADAKARCRLEGASLFVPDSKADTEAVATLMTTKLQSGFKWGWIGIHDLLSEGEFVTIEGIPIDEVYHQWDNWEPNNHNDDEHCVSLTTNGKMNDERCNKKFPFVCKKPRSSVEWNVVCEMPDLAYQYERELGKCYKVHLNPKNWTEAYGVCSAEQSYLAVINSKKESEHLQKIVADAPKANIRAPGYLSGAVHLGFHNKLNDGFVTVQGVKLEDTGYVEWGRGQPDNAGGTEQCGSMFYDGTLNDITCGVVCIFVCEHDIAGLSASVDERIKDNVAL